jgi:uncharacterized protein YebE (UPF0316 family)
MVVELSNIILIALVFFSRIIDVGMGTLRMIFISKGFKYIAPILGFFEVLVWIVVVSKLMSNSTHFLLYVAYAAGFSAGTFVGMKLEEKLSLGKVMIQIITQKDSDELIKKLNQADYPLTITDAKGKKGEVKIIFSVINKKGLGKIVKIIKEHNPKAFYSIEDIRYAYDSNLIPTRNLFRFNRKFK